MSVHIIGAGLAGLAAAVRLGEQGRNVTLHEATDHAGGRCRSYYDARLDRRIDNGHHLLLTGNKEAANYIRAIGAEDRFCISEQAVFPFLDLLNGERWDVRLGWNGRVPGGGIRSLLSVLSLFWTGPGTTVRDVFHQTRLDTRNFWDPLSISVLNTPSEEASAALLRPVLKQTILKGEKACRAMVAKEGLSDSLITPAVDRLENLGTKILFSDRLLSLSLEEGKVRHLHFENEKITLGLEDKVILAVPPNVVRLLIPDLALPDQFRPIVNAHFLLPDEGHDGLFMGLVGGQSHWLFVRGDVASVTVSAAGDLVDKPSTDIAALLWRDVCSALNWPEKPLPAYRVLKEKRATISQTPEQVKFRPTTRTRWHNLFLAGDWTDTGLPATLEGAVTSGHRAAALCV